MKKCFAILVGVLLARAAFPLDVVLDAPIYATNATKRAEVHVFSGNLDVLRSGATNKPAFTIPDYKTYDAAGNIVKEGRSLIYVQDIYAALGASVASNELARFLMVFDKVAKYKLSH